MAGQLQIRHLSHYAISHFSLSVLSPPYNVFCISSCTYCCTYFFQKKLYDYSFFQKKPNAYFQAIKEQLEEFFYQVEDKYSFGICQSICYVVSPQFSDNYYRAELIDALCNSLTPAISISNEVRTVDNDIGDLG